jgi:O-antigen/teichoic acid export membrane protein
MAAEIMFGIFFNLSFWYKLTDRTIWGAYFSGIGAVLLVVVDVLFIPEYSYMACAWAGFVAYGVSMLLSYFIGQHYYPIRYPLADMALYVLTTIAAFCVMTWGRENLPLWASLVLNTLLVVAFLATIVKRDIPLGNLPVIGKHFKKKQKIA